MFAEWTVEHVVRAVDLMIQWLNEGTEWGGKGVTCQTPEIEFIMLLILWQSPVLQHTMLKYRIYQPNER